MKIPIHQRKTVRDEYDLVTKVRNILYYQVAVNDLSLSRYMEAVLPESPLWERMKNHGCLDTGVYLVRVVKLNVLRKNLLFFNSCSLSNRSFNNKVDWVQSNAIR